VTEFDALIVSAGAKSPSLIKATVDRLIIAGWTGRDQVALEAHIIELEKLGVARPKTTPIFYRVASSLLSTKREIEVVGRNSSGEVEPVVIRLPEGLCLGVGSDHTDRKIEMIGITVSKQLCAKPIGHQWWPFSEVEDHWDALVIRSVAVRAGSRRLYQEGSLKAMRHPTELAARCFESSRELPIGVAMFCGTLAVDGPIEHADEYELEIEDPVLQRSILHHYVVKTLPTE
jgi:hypothetical protein